jgi:acyl carrier protein
MLEQLELLETEKTIMEIFWQSLEGGRYNIAEIKKRLNADTSFNDIGVDSLEMVDFYLRLQDRFEITIRQEDFDLLTSVGAVRAYIDSQKNKVEA